MSVSGWIFSRELAEYAEGVLMFSGSQNGGRGLLLSVECSDSPKHLILPRVAHHHN